MIMGNKWIVLLSLLYEAMALQTSSVLLSHCNRTDTLHDYCGPCAPDDFIANCRTNVRFKDEHILPDEWELMLDSHDYENLIQDSRPAWIRDSEQVTNDIDSWGGLLGCKISQALGKFQYGLFKWTQRGGICQYDLRACGYESGQQDNWIFTQHIKYPAGSLTMGTTEIYLNITFRFSQCSSNPACTNDFVTLHRFDTNAIEPISRQNDSANYYIPLFGPGTETTDSRLQQVGTTDVGVVRSFETPGNYAGFYLGIQDTGTCGQVKRIFLYYTPCKELLDGLVYYPELVRPPAGSPNPNIAEACCAPNAHSTTSLTFRAFSDGRCERDVICECDAGYEIGGNRMECIACPAGRYRSSTDPQETCLDCPRNTVGDEVAAIECPCTEGYYRDTIEGPGDACTSVPSEPVSPIATTGSTWIFVQWGPPTNLGGRDDTYYTVEYQETSSTDGFIQSCSMVTESRSCNITGLKSVTVYRIRVISENGVSDQDDRLGIEETRTIEILAETKEGLPGVPFNVMVVDNIVCLWQPPTVPNGVIRGYEIALDYNSSETNGIVEIDPIYTNSSTFVYILTRGILPENVTAGIKVRANTSAGYGDFSDRIVFVPFAAVIVERIVVVCELSDMALYIAIAAVVGFALAAILVFLLWLVCSLCCCKEKRSGKEDISKDPGFSNNHLHSMPSSDTKW